MPIDSFGNYTPHRLFVREVLALEGYASLEEWLEEHMLDDAAPACCSEGCEVEPDGRCPHGFPSILLAAGFI